MNVPRSASLTFIFVLLRTISPYVTLGTETLTLIVLLDTFGELNVIVELPDDTPFNVTVWLTFQFDGVNVKIDGFTFTYELLTLIVIVWLFVGCLSNLTVKVSEFPVVIDDDVLLKIISPYVADEPPPPEPPLFWSNAYSSLIAPTIVLLEVCKPLSVWRWYDERLIFDNWLFT